MASHLTLSVLLIISSVNCQVACSSLSKNSERNSALGVCIDENLAMDGINKVTIMEILWAGIVQSV